MTLWPRTIFPQVAVQRTRIYSICCRSDPAGTAGGDHWPRDKTKRPLAFPFLYGEGVVVNYAPAQSRTREAVTVVTERMPAILNTL